MSYWYGGGPDPRTLSERERRAWLANLERCHAERRIRFTSLANTELPDIKELVELATDDKELAEDAMSSAYEQRLWAAVEIDNAKSGYQFPVG
jgi:hypothetical protein